MKNPKALLSAILTVAMLASMAAIPGAASETQASQAAEIGVKADTAVSAEGDPSTFSWDNATVYFLITDRFKNGDTSNDNAYGRQDINLGDNRALMHGGDFAGITQAINDNYFNDLGVNAIWLTAPYEQIHGYIQGGPGYAHYSYHGYYVLDYTETDQALGSKEEFRKLVDTAHEHGIRIIMDIVMNHAGYNSLKDMNDYGFGNLKDGWEAVYNGGDVDNYHSVIDYDNGADKWGKWWGPDWIRCGVAGYTEGEGGSDLTRCLEGLPDFRTESTTQVGIPPLLQTKWGMEGTLAAKTAKYGSTGTVTGYISTWLSEWVREFGVDGFRCDTAKHVEFGSWKQLKDKCVEALADWKKNNPDKKLDDLPFWMTGECWDHGVGKDGYYTQGGFDSMINFECTGGGILDAGSVGGKYSDYAAAINTDDSFNVLTYMSSHDTTLARGDNYYLGSAFLMLPGAVQIFYGDETAREKVSGFDDSFKAGHCLRSDMNWGQNDDLLAHWQKVGTFRNKHIAVGAGANVSLTASSGVAFGRTYKKNGIEDNIIGVVGAAANTDVTINVGDVFEDNTTVMNYYDESVYAVVDGTVTVNSGEHGTILLEKSEGGIIAYVKGAASNFKDTLDVTVTLDGIDEVKLCVDDGNKFMAKNGDTFTIGETAYPGDTVVVKMYFTDQKGKDVEKSFKFKKDSDGNDVDQRSDKAIVHVHTSLSAPNIYAWQGDGTTAVKLAGDWPGTALSTKDDDGFYVIDLTTTDAYNIIINSGGGQTGDVTGLKGETWVTVDDKFGVKTYTSKTDALKAIGVDVPESDFAALKKVCREIKNFEESELTSASRSAAMSVVSEADTLIAKGEKNVDAADVTAMYKKVLAARQALVLANPKVDAFKSGDTTIKGKAATEAEVTVEIDGKKYNATSDDITGAWSVTVPAVNDSTVAKVSAVKKEIASGTVSATINGTDTSDEDTDTTTTDTSTDEGTDTETATDTSTDEGTDTDTATDTSTDESTDSDEPVTPGDGDVNGDKKTSIRDCSMILRADVGLITLTDAQKKSADVDGNGKVETKDAYVLQAKVTANYKG